MATFSVAFFFFGGSYDKVVPAPARPLSGYWPLRMKQNFMFKRLDKPTSQAKIPPISGKLHLSLGRPTVIARAYDFNLAVATPREEKAP
jgi:hypothetical protein